MTYLPLIVSGKRQSIQISKADQVASIVVLSQKAVHSGNEPTMVRDVDDMVSRQAPSLLIQDK